MLGLLLSLAAVAGTMTVDVLDVGQGDSLLVTSPAGKRVLIDAGTGKHDVAPMLERRGVEKLDLIIATHPHADHIGGMDEVLDALEVGVCPAADCRRCRITSEATCHGWGTPLIPYHCLAMKG